MILKTFPRIMWKRWDPGKYLRLPWELCPSCSHFLSRVSFYGLILGPQRLRWLLLPWEFLQKHQAPPPKSVCTPLLIWMVCSTDETGSRTVSKKTFWKQCFLSPVLPLIHPLPGLLTQKASPQACPQLSPQSLPHMHLIPTMPRSLLATKGAGSDALY